MPRAVKREATSRSGTSRSYADRVAKGRPNVTVSMAADTVALLARLADHYGLSKSAVIDLALRELEKKIR